MPELPEVETIKNAISKAIKNAKIDNVIVRNDSFRVKTPIDFAKKIKGLKINSYERIAKYIVINLENNLSIIWHLGMSGRVKICDKTPEILEKHDHIIIETSNGTLIYNDARRFGLITYTDTDKIREHKLFKNTGIEPFDEKLDGKFLFEKLKNKNIAIKVALLDQSIINGIGNIYASEILFLAKVLPTRKSNEISKKECDEIVKQTIVVLNQAIEAGGSTLKDYRKPDGSMGYFQNLHCVYNKSGQRCIGCTCEFEKTVGVQKIVQAGRSTFYCATKQK